MKSKPFIYSHKNQWESALKSNNLWCFKHISWNNFQDPQFLPNWNWTKTGIKLGTVHKQTQCSSNKQKEEKFSSN